MAIMIFMDTIPDMISYPFPQRISPYADVMENAVHAWIYEYDFLPEEICEKYKQFHFGKMCALLYSGATLERLIPIARWMLCLFIYDDYIGQYPVDRLRNYCREVVDTYKSQDAPAGYNGLLRQIALLRNEFLTHMPTRGAWLNRFIESHIFYFEGLCAETAFYRKKDAANYPPLNTYIDVRERLAGVYMMIDMVEISAGLILPEEVLLHPVIQRIRKLVSYMTGWCNDYYSAAKEYREKEVMNLVLVIKNTRSCTLDEAYASAAGLHDSMLEEYLQLRTALPDFGAHHRLVETYLQHLELFLQGHLVWYQQVTKRYV